MNQCAYSPSPLVVHLTCQPAILPDFLPSHKNNHFVTLKCSTEGDIHHRLAPKEKSMAVAEGSWISLVLGVLSLTFVILNLSSRQKVPNRTQVLQPAVVTQSMNIPPASVQPVPLDPISGEEQREELEAKLETAYREKWIKEWEEEEFKRHFREIAYLHEAQWQEEEMGKFEEDQMMLFQLMRHRETL
jgi:hypothetical protein